MTFARLIVPAAAGVAAVLAAYSAYAQGAPRWTTSIGLIFAENCTRCHGGDNPRAGLNLTSYDLAMRGSSRGAVVVCGVDANQSLLIQRVTGVVPPQMPRGAAPLSPELISAIGTWIQSGCPN